MSEVLEGGVYDHQFGTHVINDSGVSNSEVYAAIARTDRALLSTIEEWVQGTKLSYDAKVALQGSAGPGASQRNGGLFYRDRYLTPSSPFEQMRLAAQATEQDDIVGNVAETTESLAFSAVSMFMEDRDQQNILNQWAADVELDARLREMWRQLFEVSQCYVATWWENKTYRVRGKTSDAGRSRRKEMTLRVPTRLTLLDPLKVVPVGPTIFGRDQLAWCATRSESKNFGDVLSDDHQAQDEIVKRLIVDKYEPAEAERKELAGMGIDVNNLWRLDPRFVFRHTLTRPGFQRFAPIRMRRVFELLDLKQQLRQMERAHIIGGTNFIVLITKGTDQHPADPREVAHLQGQVRTIARVPVLVGDHRLHVEIITPKLDQTLRAERFNTIDSRITATLYGMFMLGNYSAGASGDDSAKLTKVVARGMESRRHMLRRTLEVHIFRPMFEGNDVLESVPKLTYHPRAIALDFDANWADFLLRLREENELSRETILSQFDLDQAHEALLRKREQELYDDTFQTQVPFSSPNPVNDPSAPEQNLPRDNGGGRRNGGGRAPGSGQGQPPRSPSNRSDRGRGVPPIENMTLSITDTDGNLVAQVPLAAVVEQAPSAAKKRKRVTCMAEGCKAKAERALLWAEGMAQIVVCPEHEDWARNKIEVDNADEVLSVRTIGGES